MQVQAIPRVGWTWSAGEGAGASIFRPQESHIVHLGLVYRMAYQKPNPVNYRLRLVHTLAVCHNGPHGDLKSTLPAWYPLLDSHLVQVSHPMNFSAMASSNIPAHNTSGWNVILCDLATLAASTYLLKSQTRRSSRVIYFNIDWRMVPCRTWDQVFRFRNL